MPSNDLVPVYDPGASRTDAPSCFKTRIELHELKRMNKGYFASHGNVFQLLGSVPMAVIEKAVPSRFGAVRDESVCVTVRTMEDYVFGEPEPKRKAKAIVHSYRGSPLRITARQLATA